MDAPAPDIRSRFLKGDSDQFIGSAANTSNQALVHSCANLRPMNQSWPLRFLQRINGSFRARLLPLAMKIVLRPGPRVGLVRLGSSYGGWWVPLLSLRHGATAFCAGAGEDISFDIELFNRGLNVVVFDPTPRAITYVATNAPNDEKFSFIPVGWWGEPTRLRFYAPRDEAHVSHSVVNLQGTQSYFEAEVDTVANLAAKLQYDDVELIKMDIEGAEHEVIESIIRSGPRPRTLCVEFDQPDSVFRAVSAVRKLERAGYRLRRIEGWNYTFTSSE